MSTALATAKQNLPSTSNSQRLIGSVLTSLTRWNPGPKLPEGLSSTSLCEAIDAQRALLVPATDAEVRSACKALLMHADGAKLNAPTAESLYAIWRAHCREMPGSLLAEYLPKVLRAWTNDFRLPQPGAVWDMIGDRMTRMQADLALMEKARWGVDDAAETIEEGERDLSPDTRAAFDKAMANLKRFGGRRVA